MGTHNNANCTWQISAPTNKIVSFKFASFDLEAHGNCQYDYVNVYDGIDTSAPLIGKYCGSVAPDLILSTSNSMTIEFITDDLVTGDGFEASYRAQTGPLEGCGGTLTDMSGAFTSPDLDPAGQPGAGQYDPYLNCLWIISVPVNNVITLSFSGFELEGESSPGVCGFDRVDVRDGSTPNDPLIISACGTVVPSDFTSSTNKLYVLFVSDAYTEAAGFSATYTTKTQTCGGSYVANDNFAPITFGSFDTQSVGQNCRWVIDTADVAKYVEVTFDSFDLQHPNNSINDCTYAYLEIRDFPLGDNGQVIRYCGSSLTSPIPDDFFSFEQVVQINLVTDLLTTGAGFTLRYKATSCSRIIKKPYSQLYSPGWPDPYPHNLDCGTTIEVEDGNEIQIFFSSFDVEYVNTCAFDYLEITNGTDAMAPAVMNKTCGSQLPDPVFVKSNMPSFTLLLMSIQKEPGTISLTRQHPTVVVEMLVVIMVLYSVVTTHRYMNQTGIAITYSRHLQEEWLQFTLLILTFIKCVMTMVVDVLTMQYMCTTETHEVHLS